MNYYIKADRFLLEQGEKLFSYLFVKEGRFAGFVNEVPVDANLLDWSGYTIAPGLFDTHIHGINGYDVMDGEQESIEQISASIVRLGVTRFLPTTLTAANASLEKALHAIAQATKKGLPGAKSAGVFLEGPYFSEVYKGAQNARYFAEPCYKEFERWQKLANGNIIKIALAPEIKGALEFIRSVTRDGVYAAIAHSGADYQCCSQAITSGANTFVHLFNGMSGLHHREPGVAGAALINEEVFTELICDGHHVHPDIAVLALRLKRDKTVLITDCMKAGLLADGSYKLGELPVIVKDKVARLKEGSLAGSTLTLIDGVKNLYIWSGEPLYKIWHLASLSPAKSIGKDLEFGSISRGKIADYVVINDDFKIHATAVGGTIKYQKT